MKLEKNLRSGGIISLRATEKSPILVLGNANKSTIVRGQTGRKDDLLKTSQ